MSAPVLPPPRPAPSGLAGVLRLDPLAPFLAILPVIAVIATSYSPEPGALALAVAVPLMVLAQPRRGLRAAALILVFASLLTLGAGWSADPAAAPSPDAPTGLPLLSPGQWASGINLSSRIASIVSLIVTAGLLSSPEDTIRAFVVHLRMPSRIGQAGTAALGFIGVLRREQQSILEAQMLRGSSLDLPLIGTAARWLRSVPALVAAAVRHAERVSMSMDARAFGAHPTRTERTDFVWRARDTLVLLLALAATAALVAAFWDDGFGLQRRFA
ncbi:energy-coupling factor transporter transmembrane protein EcfT [Actinomyces sp. B33]|uniref:energy-coupling factor transporter transmembrane component T n=1 Tax=Actinomyces sp. B33 TaxID=2942131 RepID=UPI00233F7E9E|nr:energy-coupling factor transporter transmembrane component T [Actinomyces sp. B33]MDC4232165.1 energy-coupling factor transporter transmembrane protein EcfT [Actinomyces sp. B33]